MVRALVLVLFLLLPVFLSGQVKQYRFSRLNADQGLSHNQVKSFFKDSHGFMWIGTISGLNRFDGYTVKVYRNDPRNPTSIISEDINRMFEDPDGRLWLSTWSGLDIYDPYTDRFRHDPTETLNRYNIPDRNLTDIVKDSRGNSWFIHQEKGVFYHNKEEKKTYHLNYVDINLYTLASNSVAAVREGKSNNFWILHRNGVIELLDVNTLKVKSRDSVLFKHFNGRPNNFQMMVDSDEDLWIYVTDSDEGLFYINPQSKSMSHYSSNASGIRLSSDIVRGVVEDENNDIWVGTDHGGVNIINKARRSVRYLLNSPDDVYSISQNSINTLYKDDQGIIWAGTFKRGIAYYHQNNMRFPLYTHSNTDATSIPFDDINAFAEDEKGNVWIGTNGGGLIYFDRSKNTFRQYTHNPNDPNSLSTNIIVSLCYDHEHKLWIGTYFGGLNCFDGKRFIRYKNDPADPQSISDNSIWEIFEDSNHNLFVGTLTKGLDVFDASRRKIANYSTAVPNTLRTNYVPAVTEDKEGNIWIGTGYGIEVIDKKTKEFNRYLSDLNTSGLSHNSILSIVQDSRGLIWIGTHGGLNYYDSGKGRFHAFTTTHGLPHNSVLTISEDKTGKLWLGTPNGISSVNLSFEKDSLIAQFTNYDHLDGLQGKQFNENAVLKMKSGELVFGGANGFNIFNPSQIPLNRTVPPVVLTSLEILNQPVTTGENSEGRTILDKAIAFSESIELKHTDNVFSIEFSSLSYNHPEKSKYKFKLEGFDKNWITRSADQRKVTYTNLDPGEYVFRVIASNNDGVWNEKGTSLRIVVHPPFYRTTYAMVLYFCLILAALFVTRKLIQQRERMKYAIEQERQEAQRMHELDMMKIKFFTNVSHEFRTPLTLILTPIERILKRPDEPVPPGQFELIYRNAKRLLNLVNQLLDFRKLEVQEIRFNPSEGDIIAFIKDTVFSFSDLSEKKGISLAFSSSVETLETFFDQDKLEKILFNLLSNAFKFTPEGGEVEVTLALMPDQFLQIRVRDTGIGIPEDKKDRIFERFFQTELPRTMVNQGSGIGLSITKEFVKVHGGTITVESSHGKGSCFVVTLPVPEVVGSKDITEPATAVTEHTDPDETISKSNHLPSILLVEDNEDFRFYLKDNLKFHYQIHEARNGKEGWERLLSLLPDLVVSDVMMPEMNGLELCRKIKGDARVSHTPVILLTARNAEEQKVEGFESGAEDYITKPFNFEILQSRVKNLIHQRELFHKDLKHKVDVKASSLQITSLDEKLLKKTLEVVEKKLSDPDFSVEELARDLGMSRVHLYKKLQALTGKSPLEYIRVIRLQHAAQLLEKSQLTVSEIAYKVGFNNPKYFARYFKEEYHMLPSAYAAAKRKPS
jgi:signal transduction histidine kinase/ligand-binding sensor domain-containing protein/DNA-binding response OmpR family regulator